MIASNRPCVAVVCLFTVAGFTSRAEARGGWNDIPFSYCYEAGAGQDAYANAFNALGNLDAEWRRSNNSDQWDGSTPAPGDKAPGGIDVELLPGEGDGGGDASVLSLEDTGDPRNQVPVFPDPSNRKLYLWRNTSEELDLARGVTLVARWRLNPEPLSDVFANNGGPLPVPNGTYLHDANKGQIGFVQKTAAGGTLAATLGLAITDDGHLQFAQAFARAPCLGLFFPDELCLDVDESGWVSIWLAVIEEAGGTGITTRLYLNGDPDPVIDTTLTGIEADTEDVPLPEAGGIASSYINIALGSTGEDGAIQVDYLCVADGFSDPPDEGTSCPSAARARTEGRDTVIEWTLGAVTPTSVDVSRDGVLIGDDAPANPPRFTDSTAEPGPHAYSLAFAVPGKTCEALTASIDTCPQGLAGTILVEGVRLAWTNSGEYAGLQVSRDGAVLDASLPGTSTTYLDAGAPAGTHTYSVRPVNGTCAGTDATVQYFAPPAAGEDFSNETAAWSYSLDPPPDADPALLLGYNPNFNETGNLDGDWYRSSDSDSWDGSSPGVVGDPALDVAGVADPASAAPGGIGLVTDGAVGAYLFEDAGDPRNGTPPAGGWLDPSNRKLYLCYNANTVIPDADTRSLITDGVTLRARFRLTPPSRAVDVANAPDGLPTQNGGKGMFSLVHDAGVTLSGASQRIGVAMDLNPAAPATGILYIGDDAGELAVPIPDPTRWLDLWLTVEDPDPATPEVDLKLYLNGSLTPTIAADNFLPNAAGAEGGAAIPPGNALYMGLNVTGDSASMEVDLVCLLDGVRAPEGGEQLVTFHRGDADSSGQLQLTDAVRILNVLFLGTGTIPCADAADADDNGQLQLTDAVRILNVLFLGTGAIPPPGPTGDPCGPDPTTADALDCAQYTRC